MTFWSLDHSVERGRDAGAQAVQDRGVYGVEENGEERETLLSLSRESGRRRLSRRPERRLHRLGHLRRRRTRPDRAQRPIRTAPGR